MKRQPTTSILILFFLLSLTLATLSAAPSDNKILTIEVKDTITAATAEMVSNAIEKGETENAEVLILMLDTPGGQLDATMKIIESIEQSRIPVVSYVHPKGAKAWSAGTFILISSHIAAMAPHTIIGSAQPVNFSPFGGSEPVTDKKVINALSLFMVERARMHGRNETAARLFIEENLNVNSIEAYELQIIEIIASDLDELLYHLDGITVTTNSGTVTLTTDEKPIVEYNPSLKVSFLQAISNPLLAYLLFTIGLYALIFGLASPGYGGEVIGAITLLLGLVGLGFDINIGALLIIALGAVLMIAEAYTSGFGIFGGGGLICLVIGGFLIIPFSSSKWMISVEWYQYFTTLTLGVAAIIGGFTLFMVYKILQARRRKPFQRGLIGVEVEVVDKILPGKTGFIRFKGEYWKAKSEETINVGSKVLVKKKEGPILVVQSLQKD
jgi:membrane-bound serine protease (ClpP class)